MGVTAEDFVRGAQVPQCIQERVSRQERKELKVCPVQGLQPKVADVGVWDYLRQLDHNW